MKLMVNLLFLLSCLIVSNIAAAQDNNLKIGAILALSGPGEYFGRELQNGMVLCKPDDVSVVFEDSKANPALGVSAFNKLVDADKISLVITVFSGVSKAILPIAKNRKVPQLATIVSCPEVLTEGGENVWRYFTSAEQDGPIMANYAMTKLGLKKVAIIYIENDYGLCYGQAFKQTFEQAGGQIVAQESFLSDTVDYSSQLLRIKQSQPEGLYLIGYDQHIIQILRKTKEFGLKTKILSNWVAASPSVVESNKNLLEGVYFTAPQFYFENWEKAKIFKENYQKRYNQTPSAYAAIGCDLARMFEGLDKNVINKLKNIHDFPGTMGILNANEKKEIGFELFPATYQNGKIVVK